MCASLSTPENSTLSLEGLMPPRSSSDTPAELALGSATASFVCPIWVYAYIGAAFSSFSISAWTKCSICPVSSLSASASSSMRVTDRSQSRTVGSTFLAVAITSARASSSALVTMVADAINCGTPPASMLPGMPKRASSV